MNISINSSAQTLVFNGKSLKFTKQNMDSVLFPLLHKEDANLDMMVRESNYTHHAVLKWFLDSVGMSAAKFFKLRKTEKLKNEILDLYNNSTSEHEIAKVYNCSIKWVKKQLSKFKIKESRKDLNNRLDERVPILLKEGYPISYIAEDVRCSLNTVRKWIAKNKKEGIVEYRKQNNIKIKRNFNEEEVELKQKLENIFAQGLGVTEAAKITGLSVCKIVYWKSKFNIKTRKDETAEKMREVVSEFIKNKMSIKEMAQKIGSISTATIRRFIKQEYGKNYIDIRMNR